MANGNNNFIASNNSFLRNELKEIMKSKMVDVGFVIQTIAMLVILASIYFYTESGDKKDKTYVSRTLPSDTYFTCPVHPQGLGWIVWPSVKNPFLITERWSGMKLNNVNGNEVKMVGKGLENVVMIITTSRPTYTTEGENLVISVLGCKFIKTKNELWKAKWNTTPEYESMKAPNSVIKKVELKVTKTPSVDNPIFIFSLAMGGIHLKLAAGA